VDGAGAIRVNWCRLQAEAVCFRTACASGVWSPNPSHVHDSLAQRTLDRVRSGTYRAGAGLNTIRRAFMKIAFLCLCLIGISAVVTASPDTLGQGVGVGSCGVNAQDIDCDCDCDD
jgi:hypothetical protein